MNAHELRTGKIDFIYEFQLISS